VRLDARTGHVLRTFALPGCCGRVLSDGAGNRLYVVPSAASDAQHLTLIAYDTRSGSTAGRLALDLPPTTQTNEPGVIRVSGPSIALSPDGGTLAVLDSRDDTLNLIDARSMKVLRTRRLSSPQSMLYRLGELLGIVPTAAYAKGIAVGTQLSIQFSRDGASLYATGYQGGYDADGQYFWRAIGLERIDVGTGQVAATALQGRAVWWLGEAADGSALYALTTEDATSYYGPFTLYRLDPNSLQVTAQRTFSDQPDLFIMGPHGLGSP
jgi:DNA-binding beta-propeller fold protein YncE